jgi:hypothetical protein
MKNKINKKQTEIKNLLSDIERHYYKLDDEYFNIIENMQALNENPDELKKIYLSLSKIQDKIDRKIDYDFKK